jgi:hypothetical protein
VLSGQSSIAVRTSQGSASSQLPATVSAATFSDPPSVTAKTPSTAIDGYDQEFTVLRGELTEVEFVADKVGTFQITCHAHPPTMVSHLVVLPRQ